MFRDYLESKLTFGKVHLNRVAREEVDYDSPWMAGVRQSMVPVIRKEGFLLAMVGPKGTGKTQLAACYAEENKEAGKKYKRYSYLTAMRFYMCLKSCYHKDSEMPEFKVMDFFRDTPLLILDEVHVRAGTEWEDNMLTTLLDERYANAKDTILISNLQPDQFVKTVGSAIASRIQETGKIMVFNGTSFREGKQ